MYATVFLTSARDVPAIELILGDQTEIHHAVHVGPDVFSSNIEVFFLDLVCRLRAIHTDNSKQV